MEKETIIKNGVELEKRDSAWLANWIVERKEKLNRWGREERIEVKDIYLILDADVVVREPIQLLIFENCKIDVVNEMKFVGNFDGFRFESCEVEGIDNIAGDNFVTSLGLINVNIKTIPAFVYNQTNSLKSLRFECDELVIDRRLGELSSLKNLSIRFTQDYQINLRREYLEYWAKVNNQPIDEYTRSDPYRFDRYYEDNVVNIGVPDDHVDYFVKKFPAKWWIYYNMDIYLEIVMECKSLRKLDFGRTLHYLDFEDDKFYKNFSSILKILAVREFRKYLARHNPSIELDGEEIIHENGGWKKASKRREYWWTAINIQTYNLIFFDNQSISNRHHIEYPKIDIEYKGEIKTVDLIHDSLDI